jgi:hypothetical protein
MVPGGIEESDEMLNTIVSTSPGREELPAHQSTEGQNENMANPRHRYDTGLGLENVQPWPEPVNGAELLSTLRDAIGRHVVLPPMAAETLALWTLHTYAFELREVSTYIGLGSPQKRCGKSTLLSVLSELVHRPVVASNISPPALFRAIEEARPEAKGGACMPTSFPPGTILGDIAPTGGNVAFEVRADGTVEVVMPPRSGRILAKVQ